MTKVAKPFQLKYGHRPATDKWIRKLGKIVSPLRQETYPKSKGWTRILLTKGDVTLVWQVYMYLPGIMLLAAGTMMGWIAWNGCTSGAGLGTTNGRFPVAMTWGAKYTGAFPGEKDFACTSIVSWNIYLPFKKKKLKLNNHFYSSLNHDFGLLPWNFCMLAWYEFNITGRGHPWEPMCVPCIASFNENQESMKRLNRLTDQK